MKRSVLDTRPLKTLSWKPVAKGRTYCSPACGGGCTLHEYKHKTREAAQLAKIMGPGWKPVVHENLGWHFHVESPCKRIEVSVRDKSPRNRSFTAYLGNNVKGQGNFVGIGKTPRAAINSAVAQAMQRKAGLDALVKGLS